MFSDVYHEIWVILIPKYATYWHKIISGRIIIISGRIIINSGRIIILAENNFKHTLLLVFPFLQREIIVGEGEGEQRGIGRHDVCRGKSELIKLQGPR